MKKNSFRFLLFGEYFLISILFSFITAYMLRFNLWGVVAVVGPIWHLHVMWVLVNEDGGSVIVILQILLSLFLWVLGFCVYLLSLKPSLKFIIFGLSVWVLCAVYNIYLFALLSLF